MFARLRARGRLALWAVPALLLVLGALGPASVLAQPGYDPEAVTETIRPGDSLEIMKTVGTAEVPPNPEICFLADTTGSMSTALADVQNGIGPIMAAVAAEAPTARFCAAQYKNTELPFELTEALTTSQADVSAAVATWTASGGGDAPEQQLHALTQLAGAATGWTAAPPATHVIVWFGDCPGHDPAFGGETLASTISALTTTGAGAPITVIAVSVASPGGCAPGYLDDTGQATAITDATSGQLFSGVDPGAVSDAILAGLTSLEVEVSMTSDCGTVTGGAVTVSFEPATQTITSGEDAVFTERITVAADAPQGETFECDDQALVNGEPLTDSAGNELFEHKTITIADITPPVVRCVSTTNPSGNNVPPAGTGTGNSGQNPDGFYELVAVDNVDPAPQIFLEDEVSGMVFGPFQSGTKIKHTQAPGATPSQKPGPGVIDWHITIQGDALVYATDASGNTSDPITCRVPPPPR